MNKRQRLVRKRAMQAEGFSLDWVIMLFLVFIGVGLYRMFMMVVTALVVK